MLIEGSIATNKTEMSVDEYVKLINSGVSSNDILVLVNNSTAKSRFIEQVLEKINVPYIENIRIHSFFGLIYNTVIENWHLLENKISFGSTTILPNMTGLEVSQFMLKDIMRDIKFEGYNSKKSLLQQLFRRYSLIVQNNLSKEDVKWRSENVLKEGFYDEAQRAIDLFLKKTLNYRSFDYLRQSLLFGYIYKSTDIFKNIRYVFVDDADEITPLCFDFIKSLKNAKYFINCDKNGSSRTGYLSADKNIYNKFLDLTNEKPIVLTNNSKTAKDAQKIFQNVIEDKCDKLQNFSYIAPSTRAEMIDIASKQINELLNQGVKPFEISIITPVIDSMLHFVLKEKLQNANLMFLSGNEKLIQNKYVLASLIILKLNMGLKQEVTEFDLRVILSDILNIPIKYCQKILEHFSKTKEISDFDFEYEEHDKNFKNFKSLINDLKLKNMKLSEQVVKISDTLFEYKHIDKNTINKFTFFVKELQDFESVYSNDFANNIKTEVLRQIETSVISENPYSILEITEHDLVIATPQKLIDNQIRTKYQIWLDTSSPEWIKSDTGPLYNAWVFQSDWNKESYTVNDDIELSKQKTARILRKLTLCAKEHIYTYASLFDGNGVENFYGIEKYINSAEDNKEPISFNIKPRDDQKPVLDYKSGKMAISAVPGAGKTTILLALIIKLLNDGVQPENIFVMTFMESAARNFRERIKDINRENNKLPNISTIHGLALRILKENSNYERLGLNSDFEICDDSRKIAILNNLANSMQLSKKDLDEFVQAVSVFKIGKGQFPKVFNNVRLKRFNTFFTMYQEQLKNENLIDYDDMLLSSVKLLEENKDILEYYQDICHYIIEDEAQDSSSIQQRLLELLSAKYKNLIRCGDVNQAITTTFTNADVEGFKHFIKSSNSVEMNCSQRCSKDVWTLANSLVKMTTENKLYENSFYKIYMKPVKDKNPVFKNGIKSFVADNTFAEKNFVLKQIKNIFSSDNNASVGILLRNNYQVASWLELINNAGFKCISRSENLEQKAVYKTIYSIMKIVSSPFDNKCLAENYRVLAENGFYKIGYKEIIQSMKEPFVCTNADNLDDELLGFYLDVQYWLGFSSLSADELALKIGTYYHSSEIEKSNVYLISTLIKRLSDTNLSKVLEKLESLAKKPSLSGFKFFTEEDSENTDYLKGKVQVMTYHKSKGDEFDYVFLPEFTEKLLPLDFEKFEIKKNTDFMETVRELNPNYKKKTDFELKEMQISENMRLLYVAITRAKKQLTFSVARKGKSYGKDITNEPSIIFEKLL